MAITNQENINVGLPNESANSDSLYIAFNKTQNNFTRLFSCSSPYNTFLNGNGISVTSNSITGTVTIENTGVLTIIPGTNITTSTFSNGAVQISSTAAGNGGSGGTVTSIDVIPASYSRLTSLGGPITANGTIILDLANSGVTAGTYTYPSVTVDSYGRVTSIANGNSVGTVTSVGVIAGPGIQVTGSPVVNNGDITVINSGVTRLNAGAGINLSESTGNITVSSVINGTVTSIELVSSTLDISGSPVVTSGSIIIDVPNNFSVTSQFLLPSSEDLGNANAANLDVVASYFTTTGASTATLAVGDNGQIKTFMMVADGGDMVITVTNAGWKTSGSGTITFDAIGEGCTLQFIANKWYCIGNNGVTFG